MDDPYLIIEYIEPPYSNGYGYYDETVLYYDDPDNVTRIDDMRVATWIDSDVWAVLRVVLYAIVIFAILVANFLLLVVVRSVRYLRTTSTRYVVAMAIADIVVAMHASLQLALTVVPSFSNNLHVCLALHLSWNLLSIVTQVLILYLAFDCYFSLWHPIDYVHKLTGTRAAAIICTAWLYAGTLALAPLAWGAKQWTGQCVVEAVLPRRYMVFLLAHWLLILLLCTLVYALTYYEIHTSKVVLEVCRSRRRQRQVYEERRRKDVHTTYTMTIVSVLYFSLWLPHYLALCAGPLGRGSKARTAALTLGEGIALLLAVYQSCFKPLLYVCKLSTFQVACYKVLCCWYSGSFPSRPSSERLHLQAISYNPRPSTSETPVSYTSTSSTGLSPQPASDNRFCPCSLYTLHPTQCPICGPSTYHYSRSKAKHRAQTQPNRTSRLYSSQHQISGHMSNHSQQNAGYRSSSLDELPQDLNEVIGLSPPPVAPRAKKQAASEHFHSDLNHIQTIEVPIEHHIVPRHTHSPAQ